MTKWLKPHECPDCHKMHSDKQKLCNVCWARIKRQEKAANKNIFPANSYEERGIKLKGRVKSINDHARRFGQGVIGHGELRRIIRKSTHCPYCGEELGTTAQFDHIIPLSRGGTNTEGNIELICKPCNQMKHDLTPSEFVAKIKQILERWA